LSGFVSRGQSSLPFPGASNAVKTAVVISHGSWAMS
jgi:hypothetical protein